VLVAGVARCPAHDRPSARARGYDARWQRTRAAFLADHPDCEQCGRPATDVHHRDWQGPLGPAGHDPLNLASLCHACHSRVTATRG
jgi:5-methylcytosine-specific restriction protein A